MRQFETNCWMNIFVRHLTCEDLFCVWSGALLKPDFGTRASHLLSQCQPNQTWEGHPLNKVMRTRRSLELSSFVSLKTDVDWEWLREVIMGLSTLTTFASFAMALSFCRLISMYCFTFHCKWTSKGKRAKTNEANEGMTVREGPQWLAEHPSRYCRIGIIWISNRNKKEVLMSVGACFNLSICAE